MADKEEGSDINLLRPRQGYMRDEVKLILVILAAWGALTFGFQGLVYLLAESPQGCSTFTRHSFFQLPFHFWFTGQFLPLCFIILALVFNWAVDRLTERHSRRREHYYD